MISKTHTVHKTSFIGYFILHVRNVTAMPSDTYEKKPTVCSSYLLPLPSFYFWARLCSFNHVIHFSSWLNCLFCHLTFTSGFNHIASKKYKSTIFFHNFSNASPSSAVCCHAPPSHSTSFFPLLQLSFSLTLSLLRIMWLSDAVAMVTSSSPKNAILSVFRSLLCPFHISCSTLPLLHHAHHCHHFIYTLIPTIWKQCLQN